ncbi:uncharacterized protein E0L32_005480, partial [Thyridium curvatum]
DGGRVAAGRAGARREGEAAGRRGRAGRVVAVLEQDGDAEERAAARDVAGGQQLGVEGVGGVEGRRVEADDGVDGRVVGLYAGQEGGDDVPAARGAGEEGAVHVIYGGLESVKGRCWQRGSRAVDEKREAGGCDQSSRC